MKTNNKATGISGLKGTWRKVGTHIRESTFPSGKKYNENYDIMESVENEGNFVLMYLGQPFCDYTVGDDIDYIIEKEHEAKQAEYDARAY